MSNKISQIAMVGWIWLILAGAAQGATTWYIDDNACPGPGTGTPVDPFCSIQRGINASVSGDEVLVAPGTYNERINFLGKAIELRSSDGPEVTTIDAAGLHDHVVACRSAEGPDTVLRGFTLTGGLAYEGGGMYNFGSHPTVINCIFFANVASAPNPVGNGSGGGMSNWNSSPSVINCVFRQNIGDGWVGGGGMANGGSSNPTVKSCTFVRNDNQGGEGGGAMVNTSTSFPTVTNCIFWDNMDVSGVGTETPIVGPAQVNYSLVQRGWTGPGGVGNIDADPQFVDPDGPDNIIGTRDDNLRLRYGSPAIDAGDNTAVTVLADLDGNPRFVDDPHTPDTGNGTPPIVDMGAYEFQNSSIPTLSEWGLMALMLVLLAAGTAIIRWRRLCGALPCASAAPPPGGPVLRAWGALVGVALCCSAALAQIQVGPQIRIDGDDESAAANETSCASSNFNPNEIVANGMKLRPKSLLLRNLALVPLGEESTAKNESPPKRD